MKTEITIESFFEQDLAKDIVNYLKIKRVENIKIQLTNGPETKDKEFESKEFEKLSAILQEYLDKDSAKFFYFNIPRLKTSFQSFTYGVDIVSEQKDVKVFFAKYDDKFTKNHTEMLL